MNYYRIGYYYKNNCGIYEHLPIKGEVTTDKNVAEKWFDLAVRQYKQRDHCYKVSEVREREDEPYIDTQWEESDSCWDYYGELDKLEGWIFEEYGLNKEEFEEVA